MLFFLLFLYETYINLTKMLSFLLFWYKTYKNAPKMLFFLLFLNKTWIGSHYLRVDHTIYISTNIHTVQKTVLLYARWRFCTQDKVEKQRHLAYNKTVLLYCTHFVFWITLYNGFFMLYRFYSLFLFYCTLCMLHVAHFVFWITLYNGFFVTHTHTHKHTHTHTHTLTHTPVYVGQFWIGSHYLRVLLKKCLFSFLSVLLYTRWRFFT
jgi:hypothetical protein